MDMGEKESLTDELVDALVYADSVDEFSRLLRTGLRRGDVSVEIATVNSPGCWVLQKRLMNTSVEVPARVEKLQVFYTAQDSEGQIVWNNGIVFRDKSSKEIETLLRDLDAAHVWERIVQLYEDKGCHRYRDLSGIYDREKWGYLCIGGKL